MKLKKTPDPEIKLDLASGIYKYRGTPRAGGPNIIRTLGVKSFNEARVAKRRLLEELQGIDLSRSDLLFGTYFEKEFMRERAKKSGKTEAQAFFCGKRLLPFFGKYRVSQITDGLWVRYLDWIREKKPGTKLGYDRRIMVMVMRRLQREGVIRHVPKFEIPDESAQEMRTFSVEEVRALMEASEDHYRGLILMMFKMGMRPGEALRLTWDRVDFTENMIRLRAQDTKTRIARDMRINPDVRTWLEKRHAESHLKAEKRKWPKPTFVFASRNKPGAPLERTNKTWERILERARKATGLEIPKPNHPYCLRHTFLTEAAKKVRTGQIPLVFVVRFAGTSIPMFERRYLHIKGSETEGVAGLMTEKIWPET